MSEKLITTAVDVLKHYQTQLDPEGIEVGVSRQALDEVLEYIERLGQENDFLKQSAIELEAENARLRTALERTPVDDMDFGDTFIDFKKLAPIDQWARIDAMLFEHGYIIAKDALRL